LDGSDGTDSLDGAEGTDACLGETVTNCESTTPSSTKYSQVLGFASVQPSGKAVEKAVAEIKATFNFTFNFQP
ncbi:MAG: hypothetical protein QOK47_976, partial [Actinomycetota bacterium]|nr:hypothetical protein [Actinomycetota bacterium]